MQIKGPTSLNQRAVRCACKVQPQDIMGLAMLCAEFDIRSLPLSTECLYRRILDCEFCREELRKEFVAYLGQTVCDASYEAQVMNRLLGFGEKLDALQEFPISNSG